MGTRVMLKALCVCVYIHMHIGRVVDVCLYYWGITCTYLFCTCQYSNISMNKAHMHFPEPFPPVCGAGISVSVCPGLML